MRLKLSGTIEARPGPNLSLTPNFSRIHADLHRSLHEVTFSTKHENAFGGRPQRATIAPVLLVWSEVVFVDGAESLNRSLARMLYSNHQLLPRISVSTHERLISVERLARRGAQ